MLYVVTERGVVVAKNVKELSKNLQGRIDMDELRHVGPDSVINLSRSDIEFIQDKTKLSNIMFGNFFRKDNSVKILMIVSLVMSFLLFILNNNLMKALQEIIKILGTFNVGG